MGITFEDKIKSGSIPREFIPAVKQGIMGAAKNGVLAGYPVTDVQVVLVDGSVHEVDSSELAFKMAGSIAFQDGMKRAHPVLLEPIMDIEIVAPEEYMGSVLGDMNSRRAKIVNLGTRANLKTARCEVPLAEMFGYVTELRSMSQGRATSTMEFFEYKEVPRNVLEKIKEGKEKLAPSVMMSTVENLPSERTQPPPCASSGVYSQWPAKCTIS